MCLVFSKLVLDRDVHRERVLCVMRLAAIRTLVEEEAGTVYTLHVVEHVALLRVGLAAQVADKLGIVVGLADQVDVVHEVFPVVHGRRDIRCNRKQQVYTSYSVKI